MWCNRNEILVSQQWRRYVEDKKVCYKCLRFFYVSNLKPVRDRLGRRRHVCDECMRRTRAAGYERG